MKRNLNIALLLIASVGLIAGAVSWGRSPQIASRPTNTSGLQQRVRSAIERASPAVVSIGNATGTIISPDGLVLSQAHVTHEGRNDGDQVDVFFSDGKKTTATLIARISSADVSLAKINGGGPFAFLQLTNRAVALGDYVIKLGHPQGYQADRGLVARLGRVICTEPGHHVTDCLLQGGDSGGPFVDLDGELVGMVDSSVGLLPGEDVPYELSAALEDSRLLRFSNASGPKRGRTLLSNIPMSLTPVAELRPYLQAMQKGKVNEPITKHRIPDPIARVGQWPNEPGPSLTLPRCDWMDGSRHIHKLIGRTGTRIDGLRQQLIEIVVNDEQRCMGFMIEDGLIVTRASTLPDEFKLFARSGVVKEITGEVLAISKSLDLALIRTEPSGLANYGPAVEASPIVGTLVFVPQMQPSSARMGIVSVAERKLASLGSSETKIPALYDYEFAARLNEFPVFLDTDIHLLQNESGSPVADTEGRLIGIAVRTTLIGTRVIPADEVLKWTRSVTNTTKP